MIEYYQKMCGWNSKSSKTKDNVRNYARYTKPKICLWEYAQKVAISFPEKLPQLYLVVQGRSQLEHSNHIVKVGVEATC